MNWKVKLTIILLIKLQEIDWATGEYFPLSQSVHATPLFKKKNNNTFYVISIIYNIFYLVLII